MCSMSWGHRTVRYGTVPYVRVCCAALCSALIPHCVDTVPYIYSYSSARTVSLTVSRCPVLYAHDVELTITEIAVGDSKTISRRSYSKASSTNTGYPTQTTWSDESGVCLQYYTVYTAYIQWYDTIAKGFMYTLLYVLYCNCTVRPVL